MSCIVSFCSIYEFTGETVADRCQPNVALVLKRAFCEDSSFGITGYLMNREKCQCLISTLLLPSKTTRSRMKEERFLSSSYAHFFTLAGWNCQRSMECGHVDLCTKNIAKFCEKVIQCAARALCAALYSYVQNSGEWELCKMCACAFLCRISYQMIAL